MLLRRQMMRKASGGGTDWQDGVPYDYILTADGQYNSFTNELPCKGTTKITMTVSSTVGGLAVIFLDNTLTEIERVSKSTASKNVCATGFETPAGAAFVRIKQTNNSWNITTAITPIA